MRLSSFAVISFKTFTRTNVKFPRKNDIGIYSCKTSLLVHFLPSFKDSVNLMNIKPFLGSRW